MALNGVNRCGSRPTLVTIPIDKLVQVIAKRAIGLKGLLVEEPLDATAQANLIGLALNADGPAHLAMPAATERDHRCACDSSGNKA